MHFAFKSHVLGKASGDGKKRKTKDHGRAQCTGMALEWGVGRAKHGRGIYDFHHRISNELRFLFVLNDFLID
jgi:hypothetical protein